MKIKRLNENYSIQSVRNIISDFQKFTEDIKPGLIEIYNELANDKKYYPEQGDRPYKMKDPMNELSVGECYAGINTFLFILHEYNNNGEMTSQFYIDLDEEEMEELLLNITAKKYNL